MSKQPVILTITENKAYYINKRPVPQNNLEAELVKVCEELIEPTIVIHASSTLSIQDLVDVMQIGARQKFKMVLATKRE